MQTQAWDPAGHLQEQLLGSHDGKSTLLKRQYQYDAVAWYRCDHLGTPMELTDHNGEMAWTAQYRAWGEDRTTGDLVPVIGVSKIVRRP
ncbi:hypothetical protein PssiTeo3_02470 [Pseudomonas sichuanensis]|nr:RHS domain-containing protein [Pseudomonas sichuanensis]MDZ4016957.1 hypothetical protein [Pseudomonas sichuanensis]UVL91486.1 RHS domain-containing protein [Pseudomonas sichuanensis]